MNFEDEKDIIGNTPDIEIADDDSVSWDSILENNDSDLISIKDEVKEQSQEQVVQQRPQSTVDLGDNLELVEDDDVDDEELAKILSNDTPKYSLEQTEQTQEAEAEAEDFDIDSQLAQVNLNEAKNNNNENFEQRQEVEQKKSSNLGCLLLLLFLLLLGGGAYWAFSYVQENDFFAKGDIQPTPTVQDNMNNLNKEDIAQRQEEVQKQDNIPVVNEEEQDKLKAQEEENKEEEEKKEVVNVIPTGRTDPFMPLKKYIYVEPAKPVEVVPTVVKTINNIDYDSNLIPPPPKKYGELEDVAERLMSILVTGIMYDEKKSSAIISYEGNDYFVQNGDKLDNYKVVDIGKDYVKIALGKNVYKAKIGEEFKITEFYGNAYLSDKQGGRQYYSSEDEYVNRKENAQKYTSADDVEIRTK